MIFSSVAVNGPSTGITIFGAAHPTYHWRCFFISGLPIEGSIGSNDGTPQAIKVSLSDLTLASCLARGGDGNGSGMGAGGGVFVNQQVTLVLRRVGFSNNQAQSGSYIPPFRRYTVVAAAAWGATVVLPAQARVQVGAGSAAMQPARVAASADPAEDLA